VRVSWRLHVAAIAIDVVSALSSFIWVQSAVRAVPSGSQSPVWAANNVITFRGARAHADTTSLDLLPLTALSNVTVLRLAHSPPRGLIFGNHNAGVFPTDLVPLHVASRTP